MKQVLFQMEGGLMKVVWCLNRSWTHDSYLILRRTMVSVASIWFEIWGSWIRV